ncbi:putative pentatricopeptide repeat-containing protein At3g15130 [Wolffia australiana]
MVFPELAAARLHAQLLKSGLFFPGHGGTPIQWNASLSSLLRRGLPSLAWRAFYAMHALDLPLCSFSLCTAVAAATAATAAAAGKQAHAIAAKSGWASATFLGGAMVDFYAKLGAMADARLVFEEIPLKSSTCANALLRGYVDAGFHRESLALLRKIKPDKFTFSAALRLCADLPSARLGKQVHALLLRGDELDAKISSLVVEMYGSCGLVEEAGRAFELGRAAGMADVVLWTCLLDAQGKNGDFEAVIRSFEEMKASGTDPDGVAFVAVLSACSENADLARGVEFLRSMVEDHGISPWPEHYGCVVRLLCGSGMADRAWELAEEVISTGMGDLEGKWQRIWGSLLVASSESGDVARGTRAAAMALRERPASAGIFVELSNLLARRGMWREIEALRKEMNRRLKKEVASSWVL